MLIIFYITIGAVMFFFYMNFCERDDEGFAGGTQMILS